MAVINIPKASLMLLIVSVIFTTCTYKPTINTDPIAGYWHGKVENIKDTDGEIQPKDIGILIIAGCTTGKVCGKFSEGGQCPGDIILTKVNGNRFHFLLETVSGTRHSCGTGATRMIVLELIPNGSMKFNFHNGITLAGTLQKK